MWVACSIRMPSDHILQGQVDRASAARDRSFEEGNTEADLWTPANSGSAEWKHCRAPSRFSNKGLYWLCNLCSKIINMFKKILFKNSFLVSTNFVLFNIDQFCRNKDLRWHLHCWNCCTSIAECLVRCLGGVQNKCNKILYHPLPVEHR